MPEYRLRQSRRPSLKIVVPVILFCTYYPYAWLILSRRTWNSYHWSWIKMWPGLPGILPRMMFFHHWPDNLSLVGMIAISLSLVALMIYLSSLRTWVFGVIAATDFILSALNSMLAYALYRS